MKRYIAVLVLAWGVLFPVQRWFTSNLADAQHVHPGTQTDSAAKQESPAATNGGLRSIQLSPYEVRVAEIEVTPVVRRFVSGEVPMVGKIEYDETRVFNITAWVPGRIDRLYVDFTGTVVRKGDPIISLYSPELLTAQAELLQAVQAGKRMESGRLPLIKKSTEATVEAARKKLQLWGLSKQKIAEIIKRGEPTDHITITAPIGGTVVHKNAQEGMYVQTGTRIYTIADLSKVWVKMEAYETDLVWIRKGQEVEFATEAYPGEVFKGAVEFIDPFLDEKTRTVDVRITTPNPDGRLKPGMLVHGSARATIGADGKVTLDPDKAENPPLVIPDSAPLITGKRAVVYVAVPEHPGAYEGREVVLGPRGGDHYLVRSGLKEGELVVVNGNFLIDSAVQILAKPSMMSPEGGGSGMAHQHGTPERPVPAASEKSMVEIPQEFKSQLEPVLNGYRAVTQAVESGPLVQIRKQFSSLGESVGKVDPDLLTGHPAMVWQEMAMLIQNDALVGSDARDLKQARSAYESLSGHIRRLSEQLQLGPPAEAAPKKEEEVHRHE